MELISYALMAFIVWIGGLLGVYCVVRIGSLAYYRTYCEFLETVQKGK